MMELKILSSSGSKFLTFFFSFSEIICSCIYFSKSERRYSRIFASVSVFRRKDPFYLNFLLVLILADFSL